MSRSLAEDPFKRRSPKKPTKKNIVINEADINQLKCHTEFLRDERNALQLEAQKKQRKKAAKDLVELFSKTKEAESELRRKQYSRDVECAREELKREAKMEGQKNQVLDKAYRRLFEDTDRVRYFKSAKAFCEMQKGREDQVVENLSKRSDLANHEALYQLGILRDIDHYKDEQREKFQIEEENKKKNARNWIKQIQEVRLKKIREKKVDHRDRFLIKEEVEKAEHDEEENAKRQRERDFDHKESLQSQMKDKLRLLKMQELLDDAEDERVKLFNEAKREMNLEHDKIKAELKKKKKSRAQYVADNMVDEKAIQAAKEKVVLEQVIRQTNEKAREEQVKEALKQDKILKELEEYRKIDMKAKQKKKYEDRLQYYQDARALNDLVDKLKVIEDSTTKKHQDLLDEAQHLQLHQIEARKMEDKMEHIKNIEEYLHHIRGMEAEENIFQQYAKKEIEECEKRGMDTYAMRKAARPGIGCGRGPLYEDRGCIRPRYYASAWKPSDLHHMERKSDKPDTKSRLGFLL